MKKLYFLSLLVSLTCCSQLPVHQQQSKGNAEQIERWTLYGKLALSSATDSGVVKLHWTQDKDEYLMRFILPLGQGSYMLSSIKDQGVTLITSDKKVFHADDVNTLLSESLGWYIPVSSLHYWVRGLPDPELLVTDQELDEQGRITVMQQQDWKISIKRYVNADEIYLPSKIFVHREQFRLRLVVHKWSIHS